MINVKLTLDSFFETTASQGASDLHLVSGRYPTIRVNGVLVPLLKESILSPKDTESFAFELLSPDQKKRFLGQGEIDFAWSFKEKARFRVNIYYERSFIAVSCRFIPSNIKNLTELNLPPSLTQFTQPSQGLLLVVGPTGQGKSTTLASLLQIINESRSVHIITIEDPIEYMFEPDKALITQREVKTDTKDFPTALSFTFRQDPDVIMIGEMRDPETISTAITAAETGHLVFATLHTNSASQTIDRIIDTFPGHQQSQVRSQLAQILLGVVSQRLLPRVNGGRVPACEIMIMNNAIRNLIRDGKTHQINMVISTSAKEGMIALDKYLADLIRREEISLDTAQRYSLNAQGMRDMVEG